MLTRSFYRLDDVIWSLKLAIQERKTEEALHWLAELIDSEEIDAITSALTTCWVVLYGYGLIGWYTAAKKILGQDEITESDIASLCVGLCTLDGREPVLGKELDVGLTDSELSIDDIEGVEGAACALHLGPPLQAARRQLQTRTRTGHVDELGLQCEKEMEGCVFWDRLFEEYGLCREKGAETDYGNTDGYEAFCEEAYGKLGYPDEWSAQEKAKSHLGAGARL